MPNKEVLQAIQFLRRQQKKTGFHIMQAERGGRAPLEIENLKLKERHYLLAIAALEKEKEKENEQS